MNRAANPERASKDQDLVGKLHQQHNSQSPHHEEWGVRFRRLHADLPKQNRSAVEMVRELRDAEN